MSAVQRLNAFPAQTQSLTLSHQLGPPSSACAPAARLPTVLHSPINPINPVPSDITGIPSKQDRPSFPNRTCHHLQAFTQNSAHIIRPLDAGQLRLSPKSERPSAPPVPQLLVQRPCLVPGPRLPPPALTNTPPQALATAVVPQFDCLQCFFRLKPSAPPLFDSLLSLTLHPLLWPALKASL